MSEEADNQVVISREEADESTLPAEAVEAWEASIAREPASGRVLPA